MPPHPSWHPEHPASAQQALRSRWRHLAQGRAMSAMDLPACCAHVGSAQRTRTKMAAEVNCFLGLQTLKDSKITGFATESPYCICIFCFTLFASFSICAAFAALTDAGESLPPLATSSRSSCASCVNFAVSLTTCSMICAFLSVAACCSFACSAGSELYTFWRSGCLGVGSFKTRGFCCV